MHNNRECQRITRGDKNVDSLCTIPCKVNRNKHKSAVAVKLIVAGNGHKSNTLVYTL